MGFDVLHTNARPFGGSVAPPAPLRRHHGRQRPDIDHRADLDVLRAVALVLVLLAQHGMSGGATGFAVSFVVSGFLLMRSIGGRIRATGSVGLVDFYGRRIRRVVPAPTVVLVVVALSTWLLLPRARWTGTAVDIVIGALYGLDLWPSGGQLAVTPDEVGAGPVAHLWAIGVTVQFAVLLPLVILLVGGATRRLRSVIGSRVLLVAAAMIGLPALAWSVLVPLTGSTTTASAVSTPLAQLALGAGVAAALRDRTPLAGVLRHAVGWTGLLTVVLVAAAITAGADPASGWWPLLAALGAVAVVAARAPADDPGQAMRSLRPIATVGRLSFVIYLCHWPLLAITSTVRGELAVVDRVLVVVGAVASAVLLDRFVARPAARLPVAGGSLPRHAGAGLATVVALGCGLTLHLAAWPPSPPAAPPSVVRAGQAESVGQVPDRSAPAPGAAVLGPQPSGDARGAPVDRPDSVTPDPSAAGNDLVDCSQNLSRATVVSCTFGDTRSSTVVALVGDTHAAQWVPALAEVATRRGWQLVVYTKAACPYADVVAVQDERPYTSCQEWHLAVRDLLLGQGRPALVVTSNGPNPDLWQDDRLISGRGANDAVADGLRRDYESLAQAGVPVVVLHDTPNPAEPVPACLAVHPLDMTACAEPRADMLAGIGDEQVAAAAGLADVQVVDLNDAICPTLSCAPVIGEALVYRDDSHLTATYMRTLWPRLETALSDVLR